jgi:hypothetical protein
MSVVKQSLLYIIKKPGDNGIILTKIYLISGV